MKQVMLESPKQRTPAPTIHSVISFQPFYRYLKQKAQSEQTVKLELYMMIDSRKKFPTFARRG